MSESRDLYLHEFAPRPMVVRPETIVTKPRFPVIDAHNHLGELLPGLRFSGDWAVRDPRELTGVLDAAGVEAVVDLDGQWGDRLRYEIDRYQAAAPGRVAVFTGLEYDAMARPDFPDVLARRIEDGARAGARGVKVWKPLGLTARDAAGKLIPPNDPRLRGVWQAAAENNLPVLIHIADPVAFFKPLDRHNERWEELRGNPPWHFHGPQYPSFDELIEQFADLVRQNPRTTFIGAHVGCYPENLTWVSRLLDECPNFHIDISARIAELGRVPYSAREFFIKHADRILFGTDWAPNVPGYLHYYRFLETRDEYFSYIPGPEPRYWQGRWMIYGLYLPDDVLRKVYAENARKLIRFG